MTRTRSLAPVIQGALVRWSPMLLVLVGFAWFTLVSPWIVATGEWANREVMQSPNTQQLAGLLVRAGVERPDLWPAPPVCNELLSLFLAQQERRLGEARCHLAAGQLLDPAQLEVLHELGVGSGAGSGFHSTADELHAVNTALQSAVGSSAVEPPMIADPTDKRMQHAERGRLAGLPALARGQGPGLRQDQARALLSVCLDSEQLSNAIPQRDRELAAVLSPELRAWMATTTSPGGHRVAAILPRCYHVAEDRHLSAIEAIVFVLREGHEVLAGCDVGWDEPEEPVDPPPPVIKNLPVVTPAAASGPQGSPPATHPQP